MFDGFWEVARIFALIVAVWFGLAGWKLLPLRLTDKSRATGTALGEN